MSNARILIVEDEQIVALEIQRRLEELGYQIAGVAADADEAFEYLRTTPIDLVLMDIILAGGPDGIDAAQVVLRDYQKPVLFVTAYSHSEIIDRAKLAGAYGYIIKPFNVRQLHSNIEIALEKHREQETFRARIEDGHIKSVRRISLRIDDEVILIDPSDLLYLEVQDGMVSLVTAQKRWCQRGTLAEWEERLRVYPFYRCHKSFMVNLKSIKSLTLNVDHSYTIKFFDTEAEIPLARNKARYLKDLLSF